jgi:ethanolamine-phosphate cytidylyltransferase
MRILVPMVADLCHHGHLILLKNIKTKYNNCNIIIGLHTNESVKKYKRLPILNYVERYKVLEACKYVDEIIEFDCETIINSEYLIKYNLDLVIHAHHKHEDDKYKQLWVNIPNNFERFDYTEGISTTEILKRISERKIL